MSAWKHYKHMSYGELQNAVNRGNRDLNSKSSWLFRTEEELSTQSTKHFFTHNLYCIQMQIFVPSFPKGGFFHQAEITNCVEEFYSFHCLEKFQDLLKSIQFVVAQECCNQNNAILIGPILTKLCEVIKNWPSSTPRAYIFWKAWIRISANENFSTFNFPRNHFIDWISQSAMGFFVSRLYKIPVMTAGSCYPSFFAAESALYRLPEECLIKKIGGSSPF